MKIVKSIPETRKEVENLKKEGGKIGFVPTMGYLHEGHISLVRRAVSECSKTIVSIFVNPTQFGPSEDFSRYPRDSERDISLLKKEGVDLVFIPSTEEIYKTNFFTYIEVVELSKNFEGSLRPGHFKGVCTIVCKLFNILSPDRAYFGWKDAQQLVIIKKMVDDLNIPIEIIGCPILREEDGLAMSSRNIYLSAEDRQNAVGLYRGLLGIKNMADEEGVKERDILLKKGKKIIESFSGIELQYLEIVALDTFLSLEKLERKSLVIGAIKLSGVRLIDNILIELM